LRLVAEAKAIQIESVRTLKLDIFWVMQTACRVILNLLSNAIKFTPQGGIQVQLERIDDHVQVTVSGISANALCLRPFLQADSKTGRTGIGDRAPS